MIAIKSPLRVSLLGGGTDFKNFYSKNGGSFLSFTIDKYIYTYISENPIFYSQKYRLCYSSTESTNQIIDIKNNIIREALILRKFKSAFHLVTVSDIPHGNGLGSSSSFACSVLHGISNLKGLKINKKKLAYEACKLEIDRIKSPIGIQDQFATSLGGLNYHIINKKGKVSTFSLDNKKKLINEIQDKSAIIQITNVKLNRNTILKEQKNNNNHINIHSLKKMKKLSDDFFKLTKNNENLYGKLVKSINLSWEEKKTLSKNISNKNIDSLFQEIKIKYSSIGHKILGAGGKGCAIIFFKKKSDRNYFIENYKKYKSMIFKISFDGIKNLNI